MPRYRLRRMFAVGITPTPVPWAKIFALPLYLGKVAPTSPEGFGEALEIVVEMDEATRNVLWDDRCDIDIRLMPDAPEH